MRCGEHRRNKWDCIWCTSTRLCDFWHVLCDVIYVWFNSNLVNIVCFEHRRSILKLKWGIYGTKGEKDKTLSIEEQKIQPEEDWLDHTKHRWNNKIARVINNTILYAKWFSLASWIPKYQYKDHCRIMSMLLECTR